MQNRRRNIDRAGLNSGKVLRLQYGAELQTRTVLGSTPKLAASLLGLEQAFPGRENRL